MIVGRHSGGQAGHCVADFGCIENVQTFDGEWNAPLGKFLNQFVAMVVLAIEHGKIAPAAALVFIVVLVLVLALPLDAARKVGGLDFFISPGNNFDPRRRRGLPFPLRLLVAQRFQGRTLVGS